jgi:hypothetical protein
MSGVIETTVYHLAELTDTANQRRSHSTFGGKTPDEVYATAQMTERLAGRNVPDPPEPSRQTVSPAGTTSIHSGLASRGLKLFSV